MQIAVLITNQVQCMYLTGHPSKCSSSSSFSRPRSNNDVCGWRGSQTHRRTYSIALLSYSDVPSQRQVIDAYYCYPGGVRGQMQPLLKLSTWLSGRAEERVAKLVDSPDRPESEASYKLDEGGWTDVWSSCSLAALGLFSTLDLSVDLQMNHVFICFVLSCCMCCCRYLVRNSSVQTKQIKIRL